MSNHARKSQQVSIFTASGILAFIILQFTLPGAAIQAILFLFIPGKMVTFLVIGIATTMAFFLLARKKRSSLFPALIFLYFVSIVPINGVLWQARDEARHDRMVSLQHQLDQHIATGHSLPVKLSPYAEFRKLLWGPFGMDTIKYHVEGHNYILESYQVPLGPFELYSSARREWYYEE